MKNPLALAGIEPATFRFVAQHLYHCATVVPVCNNKLRIPNYMTTAQDGGKVVSPTYQPPLCPGNASGTHFC